MKAMLFSLFSQKTSKNQLGVKGQLRYSDVYSADVAVCHLKVGDHE